MPSESTAADSPEAILAELIACADQPGFSNAGIAACVQAHLRRAGVEPVVLPGPEGDRVNILASIGPTDRPGIVLSGHMDVVPAIGQSWASEPFRLTPRDGRLYGRGTSDMKGFLACMLAMVPQIAAQPRDWPIHLAFSYDEELGCRGVGHLIAALPGLIAPPRAVVVGEPTRMQPVLSHKGKQSTRLTVHGQAAHSADPSAGVNAAYAGAALGLAVRDLNLRLAVQGPFDDRFTPPHSTAVCGVIAGGTAVNIIPDRCLLEVEVRSIPGDDAGAITADLLATARALVETGAATAIEAEVVSAYPALPPVEDEALIRLLTEASGHVPVASVSYGTEAGMFHAAGIPAIICGPGDINRAHRADEYILPEELAAGCAMIGALASRPDPA